jgi:post-segregation antitoxin (ccd killing protein)
MSPKPAIRSGRRTPRLGKAKTVAARLPQTRDRREEWRRENAEAIAEYNALVTRQGVFSAGVRGF